MVVGWDTPLRTVVGSTATELAENRRLRTVGELLGDYPHRYLEVDEVSSIADPIARNVRWHTTRISRLVTRARPRVG